MKKLLAAAALAALLSACGQQSASDIASADAAAEAETYARENAEIVAAGAKNLETGKAYLTENAAVAGVATLPTGVQYRVIKAVPGAGATPGPEDEVTVHYEGKLIDGKVFDSSYKRGEPTSFGLNMVIPGWSAAVQQMKVGDIFEVVIPPDQGYGPEPKGEIPPNSVLIFKLELLGFQPARGQG